jgi:hypothetical protein
MGFLFKYAKSSKIKYFCGFFFKKYAKTSKINEFLQLFLKNLQNPKNYQFSTFFFEFLQKCTKLKDVPHFSNISTNIYHTLSTYFSDMYHTFLIKTHFTLTVTYNPSTPSFYHIPATFPAHYSPPGTKTQTLVSQSIGNLPHLPRPHSQRSTKTETLAEASKNGTDSSNSS